MNESDGSVNEEYAAKKIDLRSLVGGMLDNAKIEATGQAQKSGASSLPVALRAEATGTKCEED